MRSWPPWIKPWRRSSSKPTRALRRQCHQGEGDALQGMKVAGMSCRSAATWMRSHTWGDSIPHASRKEAFDEADGDGWCILDSVDLHGVWRGDGWADVDGRSGRPARAVLWTAIHDGPGDDGDANDEHDVPYDGDDEQRRDGSEGHDPDARVSRGSPQGDGRGDAETRQSHRNGQVTLVSVPWS